MSPQAQGLNSQTRREGLQRVFVYGTLKKGFGNHERLLKECKELGTATIEGIMFHLGAFPAISLGEPFGKIHGEVYEVSWDKLIDLDQLEGVGHNFYDRIEAKVHPHGAVWTYIFPHARAAKEQFVVPSGVWRGGADTVKVKWGGFGKGVEIAAFQTNSASPDEIQVGGGERADYVLRRSGLDQTYKLINKKTGEILGSYKHLRDIVGREGTTKPVLRLPAVTRSGGEHAPVPAGAAVEPNPNPVDAVVKDTLFTNARPIPPHQQHPSHPILWTPHGGYPGPRTAATHPEIPAVSPPEKLPQAVRLLGMKYGEA